MIARRRRPAQGALVLALLLALGSPALGAGDAPQVVAFTVPDLVLQPAEDMLARMDILQGDGRGHYREGEAITRGEMAALMVRSLGLADDARALAKQKSTFSDVGNHWAAGDIAMAAQKKLMRGYPDGTFQPNRFLSYAEALVVLERTVDVTVPAGTWPDNVMAAAVQANLVRPELRGAMRPGDAALRGVLFVLVADSLKRPASDGVPMADHITGADGPHVTAHANITGTQTTQDHVAVSGTVSGALLVTVAGTPASVHDGAFTVDVPLSPGNNTFVVLATDADNRQASQWLTVTRILYAQ